MIGISPPVLIKQLIADASTEGIARAEIQLKNVLVDAMPSLVFKGRLRASSNDVDKSPETMEVRSHGSYFFLSYCGTRQAGLGAYLLVRIHFPLDQSGKHLLKYHAHELPFVRSIIAAPGQSGGMVTVGQTRADARSLVVVSGRKFDVFGYLLASDAGLDRLYAKPGEENMQKSRLWSELSEISGELLESSKVVNVSGWGKGLFLRRCFRQLSGVVSPRAFDKKFGHQGVSWRPRSPLQWIRHRIYP